MTKPARNCDESYEDYQARRKKENLFAARALKPRDCEEGVYEGSAPIYIQAHDPKTGKMIIPIFWVKARKGVPFRKGVNHPKTSP